MPKQIHDFFKQEPDRTSMPMTDEDNGQDAGLPPTSPEQKETEALLSYWINPATTSVMSEAASDIQPKDTVVENIANGTRTLQYLGRTASIPIAQTPEFGASGFGYYARDKGEILYYPIGDAGPLSLQSFSAYPKEVITSMHQVMSINLSDRFNGDWQQFMARASRIVWWFRMTDSDEGDRISEALYRKASEELPGFAEHVSRWNW